MCTPSTSSGGHRSGGPQRWRKARSTCSTRAAHKAANAASHPVTLVYALRSSVTTWQPVLNSVPQGSETVQMTPWVAWRKLAGTSDGRKIASPLPFPAVGGGGRGGQHEVRGARAGGVERENVQCDLVGDGALGGTRTPSLQIRRSMEHVRSVRWNPHWQ